MFSLPSEKMTDFAAEIWLQYKVSPTDSDCTKLIANRCHVLGRQCKS